MTRLVVSAPDNYASLRRTQKFRVSGRVKSTAPNARGDIVNEQTEITYDAVVPIYIEHSTDRRIGSCTLHRGPRGVEMRGIIELDEGYDAEVLATLLQYKFSIGSEMFAGEDREPAGLAGRRQLRNLHIREISLTKSPADRLTTLHVERIF